MTTTTAMIRMQASAVQREESDRTAVTDTRPVPSSPQNTFTIWPEASMVSAPYTLHE